jgi:hypothetical protein
VPAVAATIPVYPSGGFEVGSTNFEADRSLGNSAMENVLIGNYSGGHYVYVTDVLLNPGIIAAWTFPSPMRRFSAGRRARLFPSPIT